MTARRRALADTSVFIGREAGRPVAPAVEAFDSAISCITLGELHAGVLAADDLAIRDLRLATLAASLRFEPLPVDVRVARHWASLRAALREAGRRMPVNDSWIAATALAHGVPVVTQDGDFDAAADIGDVEVIRV